MISKQFFLIEPQVTVCKGTTASIFAEAAGIMNGWAGVYLMGTGKTAKIK